MFFEMLARLQFVLFLSVTVNKVRLFQYYLRVIVIIQVVFVGMESGFLKWECPFADLQFCII